jgi:hypothetical protein
MFIQSIRYKWYDFRCGVKNLIKWYKIIWADRSWDHAFIYKIIEHKLRLQSDSMRSGILLEKDKYAEQMLEVAELAKRLADTWTYYDEPAVDNFDAIWGETKIDFEPVDGSDGQYFTMVTRKADGTSFTEDEDEKMSAARRVMYKETRRQINTDKRKFFAKITNNIDHWWW